MTPSPPRGRRRRIVPTLGHLAVSMVTNGAVDRAVHSWIADECSRSTVENSLAVLVRVLEQAVHDWSAPTNLADALVPRSSDSFRGWGDVVIFAACTAARIGEGSGRRVGDINTGTWRWTVRRQTTPSPGGLADNG